VQLRLKPRWQNRHIILTGKPLWLSFRLCCDLTPSIPLSFKGEGEVVFEEGLTPLSDTPEYRRSLRGGVSLLF